MRFIHLAVLGLLAFCANAKNIPKAKLVKRATGGLTQEQKDSLLSKHNYYRKQEVLASREANGNGAAGIRELEWSDQLASLAQKLADTCSFHHEFLSYKNTKGQMIYVGQNIAQVPPGVPATNALDRWYKKERDNYDYDQDKCLELPCGHYLQMVFSKTTEVGCAATECPNWDNTLFVVCDYHAMYTPAILPYPMSPDACSRCNMRPGSKCDESTGNLCEKCDPSNSPDSDCVPFDPSECKGREPGIDPYLCMLMDYYQLCDEKDWFYWELAHDCGNECGSICVTQDDFPDEL